MKSYQFAGRPIYAADASRLNEIFKQADGELAGTVIDLRTFLEVGEVSSPKPPDGWSYRRLPVTGAIISEQDLDVFRRELVRKPQTVVVGPNACRPELLLSASLARYEQASWDTTSQQSNADESEHELLEWLVRYLVRHGVERPENLALFPAATPAASPAVEPTVEMEAIGSAEPSLEIEPTVELSLGKTSATRGTTSSKAKGAAASDKTKRRSGKKSVKKTP